MIGKNEMEKVNETKKRKYKKNREKEEKGKYDRK